MVNGNSQPLTQAMEVVLAISTMYIMVTGINCNHKFKLHGILLEHYNKDVIPKSNHSEAIDVRITMVIYSIDEVDEKYQKISFRAALDIQWIDEFLKWNPDKYGGVRSITIPVEKIWIPDIVLLDTYRSIKDSTRIEGIAMVKYTGRVMIWPYDLYTVACKISVAKFPFDKQVCGLDFLSWTNPSSSVHLYSWYMYSDVKPLDHFVLEKGEWLLQNVTIKNETKPFREEYWDHVVFSLELQRKSLFHILNTVIPVILISMLDVFCFMLPSESGERIALSISVFLTLAVFLSAVNSSVPESSDEVSVLNIFIGLHILGSALSVIMTNISLYFYYKSAHHSVPVLLLYFVKLCNCVCGSTKRIKQISDVTWQMVARALDRFCLGSAIIWHLVLISCLINAAY